MIIRLLITFVIVVLVIMLWKRLRRSKSTTNADQPNPFEETVACKTCGLRLPKSEAIEYDGAWFCCEEHSKR